MRAALLAFTCLVSGATYPQKLPNDIDVTETDAPAGMRGLPIEWKRIETARSGAVIAAVARPLGTGPFYTLVLVHGSHGFAREYVSLAREFASHGFLTVAACWFRGGEPSDRSVSEPIPCPDAIDMPAGPSEAARLAVADLVAAVRKLPDVRPDHVAVFGHSRGGGATLNYLRHGGWADAAIMNSAGYPDEAIDGAHLIRMPMLVLHGARDQNSEFTTIGRARRFVAAAKDNDPGFRSHFYPQGAHNGLFTDRAQHEDEVRRIVAFLRTRSAG